MSPRDGRGYGIARGATERGEGGGDEQSRGRGGRGESRVGGEPCRLYRPVGAARTEARCPGKGREGEREPRGQGWGTRVDQLGSPATRGSLTEKCRESRTAGRVRPAAKTEFVPALYARLIYARLAKLTGEPAGGGPSGEGGEEGGSAGGRFRDAREELTRASAHGLFRRGRFLISRVKIEGVQRGGMRGARIWGEGCTGTTGLAIPSLVANSDDSIRRTRVASWYSWERMGFELGTSGSDGIEIDMRLRLQISFNIKVQINHFGFA